MEWAGQGVTGLYAYPMSKGRDFRSNPFVGAWIMAQAFIHKSKWIAALGYPACLLAAVVAASQRRLFVTKANDGMFILSRHPPIADALITPAFLILIVVLVAAPFALVGVDPTAPILITMATLLVFLLPYFAVNRPTKRIWQSPITNNTPPGSRYLLGSLAQKTGTRFSAMFLARTVIVSLPPGTVIVSIAANTTLLRQYVRLGFTEDLDNRVHIVVTPALREARVK